jgi:hypothetical protein
MHDAHELAHFALFRGDHLARQPDPEAMSLLISILEFSASLAGALFAGAAALQWAPSYKRATLLQAPLALVSLGCGLGAWLLGAGPGFLIAAVLVGAVVPFTFLVIMPTNNKLLESGRDLSSAETRGLLIRWGRLHAVRTVLSLCGAAVYLWQLSAA